MRGRASARGHRSAAPPRGVLVRRDELGLIRKEEIAAREPLRADEARFGARPTTQRDPDASEPCDRRLQPRVRARTRIALHPNVRRAVLTVHIVAGVGLLGDVGAVLAVNVRAATTADPQLAAAVLRAAEDVHACCSGSRSACSRWPPACCSASRSKWGVLRYGWVTPSSCCCWA